jgi:hypothetical protein
MAGGLRSWIHRLQRPQRRTGPVQERERLCLTTLDGKLQYLPSVRTRNGSAAPASFRVAPCPTSMISRDQLCQDDKSLGIPHDLLFSPIDSDFRAPAPFAFA